MNKKAVERLRYILLAVFTGIGIVQVIYAISWAFLNGNNIQDFYDTAVYLKSAQGLTSDGWHLAGYACILRLFGCLKGMVGEWYVVFVYVAQILCSVAAFSCGVRTVVKVFWNKECSWKQALLISGYLITLPVIWQMQFALLPDALCLALLVLLFSQLLLLLFQPKSIKWECMWIITGTLLFLGVLHHHYFYGAAGLITVTVAVFVIKQFFRKYRSKSGILTAGLLLLVLILSTFIVQGVNKSVPKEETYAEHTMSAELWSRFVYPHILEDLEHYPEDVVLALSEGVTLSGKEYYEYYLTDIIPQMEAFSEESASTLCMDMVFISAKEHKGEVLKSLAKEGIAYAFIPLSTVKYMYENGGSLYGHNLMKMWEKAPELTMDYMHVSMNGFLLVCCMGVGLFFAEMISGDLKFRHLLKTVAIAFAGIVSAVFPMMLVAFEKFDYRIGLFSVFIWGVITVSLIAGRKWRNEDEYRCDK